MQRDKRGLPIIENHTTTLEYNANGSIKSKETKNDNGTILYKLENDADGRVISEKKFYSDGTLYYSKEATWKDENTKEIITKNGKGEIQQKQVSIYKDKKPVTSTIYNKDGGLIQESAYNEDGKRVGIKVYHKDGKTLNEEIETFPDGGGFKSRKIYNEEGKLEHEYVADMVPDGKSWDKHSSQGTGDCYLLSSINAIRQLENGDKMLSDLIDIKTDANGKKTYTVTLPGAKVAADSLKKDGLKVAITGTYTFTEEEFEKIAKKQGIKYSMGNANIILLEAAFEKYRQEVKTTVKTNNISMNDLKHSQFGIVGLEGASGELDGGLPFDATFVLTGKPSETYLVAHTGRGLDVDALSRGEAVVISDKRSDNVSAGVSSIDGEIATDKQKLNKMLDKVMNDMKDGKKDVIATVSFRVYVNGKDSGGHAFTIKEVTEDTVTMINPWYPEQTITMSRSELLKTATGVSVSDTSKETVIKEERIQKQKNSEPKQKENTETPNKEKPATEQDKKRLKKLINRVIKQSKDGPQNNKGNEEPNTKPKSNEPSKQKIQELFNKYKKIISK